MNENFKYKLNTDICIIISEILKPVGTQIEAIVLYGSYGRDEGAFYIEKGEVFVYNDYDILLIVKNKKRILEKEIQKIQDTLLNFIDIKWIEISQVTKNNLRKLKPSIYNFDLKYGSRVIWGDHNILDSIPAFKTDQITLKDAEVLYFTRLYTFLGSLKLNAFAIGIKGEDSRFFRNQMAKAVLSIVDVLLLQKNMYDTSYRERVDRLANLYPLKKELIELSRWALLEKMTPFAKVMNPKETKDLHTQVLSLYHKEMHIALSKLYAKKIVTTDDLRKAKFLSFRELIFKIKILIMTKTLKYYHKQNYIIFAQCYAVESFIKEGIEKDMILNKCKILVNKIGSTLKVEDITWEDLKSLIVKLSR